MNYMKKKFALVIISIFSLSLSKRVLEPIIFTGGIGGMGLEVKLHKAPEPHWWCKNDNEWFQIWMNIYEEIPYLSMDCFYNNLELHFNESDLTFHNSPGVSLRPVDFGGVGAFEYLAPQGYLKKLTAYMHEWITWLEEKGYERGVSFRGAPHDWRMGPKEFSMDGGAYEDVKKLVEETYEMNGRKKVHVIGHSNGAPFWQYFLGGYMGNNQEWKDKYIASFISLGGPYDGAKIAAWTQVIQFTYYQPFLKPNPKWKKILSQIAGLQWLIPTKYLLNDTLIKTDNGDFSYVDYKKILELSNNSISWKIFEWENDCDKTIPPKVPTHCIYGTEIDTPAEFYVNDLTNVDISQSYIVKNVTGDGTVHDASLRVCDGWKDKQSESVFVHRSKNFQHTSMVKFEELWNIVWNITTHNE